MKPTPRRRVASVVAAVFAMLLTIGSAGQAGTAAAATIDSKAAVRTSQSALGRAVADREFVLPDGRTLNLAALRGEPVVVSFVYTSCHEICPGATVALKQAARTAREVLRGNRFSVITVGFDVGSDTPKRMGEFARSLQVQNEPRWYFASGTEAAVLGLARDLGFTFAATPRGFDHIVQTTVLDREGRVAAQVYGDVISERALVEPLKRIYVGGGPMFAPVGLLERARLLCTLYDPKSGRYRFDWSLPLSIAIGVLCLGAIAGFIVHLLRSPRNA